MEINFTLFVQAFNFFVAYVMVRYLLLNPAIRCIQQDEEHKALLLDAIAQLEEGIANEERARKKNWAQCRLFFLKKRPDVMDQQLHIFKYKNFTKPHIVFSTEQKEVAIRLAVDSLQDKIGGVQ